MGSRRERCTKLMSAGIITFLEISICLRDNKPSSASVDKIEKLATILVNQLVLWAQSLAHCTPKEVM